MFVMILKAELGHDFVAHRSLEQYACLVLLISAVFALILGVTYFVPIVLPGLLILAVGAGASIAASKIVFRLFGSPDRSR